MRMKNVAAALLVAAGASLAMAVPAQADPADDQSAQRDQAFLQAVQDQGLRLKSDAFALDLAKSTCGTLARTESIAKALVHIKNATDWDDEKDIGNFGGLAVQVYCPTSMPKT